MRKPAFYLVSVVVLLMGIVGFSLLANPILLNMAANFTPLFIEINLDGEMRGIEFRQEDRAPIGDLLQYDTWKKATMKYDLSTMTYLLWEEEKIIAVYENVDGHTFMQLYRGFGLMNGRFYKTSPQVYANVKKYLFQHYVKEEDSQDSGNPPHEDSQNSGKASDDNPPSQRPWHFFNLLQNLRQRYGYDNGVVLYSDLQKAKVLVYNEEILSRDCLLSKIITVNRVDGTELEEGVYLPEDLLGHFAYFKFGDSADKKHLLGVRYKIDPGQKKLFSDLFVMDKDTLQQYTVLQSYTLDYDKPLGIIPQGDIPTIIDFSVDVVDDYIVYQDIDENWKVQDISTRKIYAGPQNDLSTAEVLQPYHDAGEYIYILKYMEDNTILAFDKARKEFQFIPYTH